MITFTVPYLRQRHWLEVGKLLDLHQANFDFQRYTNGQIRFTIVNPVNTSNTIADSTISAVVWICGGDSFQVAFPTSLPANYTAHAQSGTVQYLDPREVMSEQAEGLIGCRLTEISGIEHGDGVESFSELARRYELQTKLSFTNVDKQRSVLLIDEVLNETRWSRIHNTFHFLRGSKRFKILFVKNAASLDYNVIKATVRTGSTPTDLTGQAPLLS